MASVKLKIVNFILAVFKKIVLWLLYLQAKYSVSDEVEELSASSKFDLRNISSRLKNVLIHDQDIIDKRWAICQGCEFFTKSHQCTKCGCFMRIKTKVATVACPMGKWDKEYNFITGKPTSAIRVTG